MTKTFLIRLQANAAKCSAVSPNDHFPPANGEIVSTWEITATRRYDCTNSSALGLDLVDSWGNFTSTDNAWTGGFYYIKDVSRWDITNTADGSTYSFNLDNKPGLTPVEGGLINARWTVNWIGKAPAGLNPGEQYMVRQNSTGGATPTKCPSTYNTKSNYTDIPFTSPCTLKHAEIGCVVVAINLIFFSLC